MTTGHGSDGGLDRAMRVTVLLAVAYVSAQLLANVASLKITDVAGLSMDAGTLVYPFTFTLRDLVHRVAGVRVARTLIFAAAAVNLFMAGLFWLVDKLPAASGIGPQTDQFGAVLAPVWRIVFASILAEIVSELVDTEVYRVWAHRFGERFLWGRVLSSNSISIPTDTFVFVTIAFLGVVPASDYWQIVTSNILVKGAITLISIPWIYWVRKGRGDDGGR